MTTLTVSAATRAKHGVPEPMKPATDTAKRALYRAVGGDTAYFVGTLAVRTRRRTWMENPECLVCEQRIEEQDQAGLVITPAGNRVACRDECYVAAILGLASVGALADRSMK